MTSVALKAQFRHFDWEKLSRVRAKAHSHNGIIGEWINWWITIDRRNHIVFEPAPASRGRYADLLFLASPKAEHSYYPVGVAEIENSPDKWRSKLETLKIYEEEYSKLKTLEFLLLCATIGPRSGYKLAKLRENIRQISENSDLSWVVYLLRQKSTGEDTNVIFDKNDEGRFYRSISKGDFCVIRKGSISNEP